MAQRKTRKSTKRTRRSYSDEYRAEALKLADSIGTTAAAGQLGIQTSQIYSWRTKLRVNQSRSEAEKALLTENAKLKRQLAERTEEVDILKNHPPNVFRVCRKRNSRYCKVRLHREAEAVRFLVASSP